MVEAREATITELRESLDTIKAGQKCEMEALRGQIDQFKNNIKTEFDSKTHLLDSEMQDMELERHRVIEL